MAFIVTRGGKDWSYVATQARAERWAARFADGGVTERAYPTVNGVELIPSSGNPTHLFTVLRDTNEYDRAYLSVAHDGTCTARWGNGIYPGRIFPSLVAAVEDLKAVFLKHSEPLGSE